MRKIVEYLKKAITVILEVKEKICKELPKVLEFLKKIVGNRIICSLIPDDIKTSINKIIEILEKVLKAKQLTEDALQNIKEEIEKLIEELKELFSNIVSVRLF